MNSLHWRQTLCHGLSYASNFTLGHKKRASYLYRTATTIYPCSVPGLGGFNGSWSYKTCPAAKVEISLE